VALLLLSWRLVRLALQDALEPVDLVVLQYEGSLQEHAVRVIIAKASVKVLRIIETHHINSIGEYYRTAPQ
jgi:hypothetical protein